MNLDEFTELKLRGGFLLLRIVVQSAPMVDALGRPAVARTSIIGNTLEIELSPENYNPSELSISLYHEVLEAAAVAATEPPPMVCELNEAGFELAARDCHKRLGPASAANLNFMLADFGF